ncbi:MAG: sulfate permease [Chlamydiales bacterium 38-26]|nr:SulP family inorganic anion transporter [Chlamydiales bacterium]OJV10998.1 MAG: sulfate permease [Chlamydiales bacterium 38-26]
MVINHTSDDISFFAFKREIFGYSWDIFRADATAALTVALITLPQAMAAALLAGLPLSSGLFAAIYSSMLASLLGSSRHLVVGPSNAIAILVQAGTAEILYTHYRDLTGVERDIMSVQILTQLTFLTGFFQVLAAGCKLGRLTQFVSYSVIVGYVVGTAFAMGITQLYVLLGIESASGVHSLYERGVHLIAQWHTIHIPTAIVGLISLLTLIFLKKIDKRIPAAMISLVCAAVGVYLVQIPVVSDFLDNLFTFGSHQSIQNILIVEDTGDLKEAIPSFELFFFNTGIMNQLLPISFAIALLSVMETTSVAKSIAACSGQTLSVNQEIFGLGMGNLLSAFIGGMPISGSASRSNLNYTSGAQTRFASAINSLVVACLLLTFGFFITKIPLAAFAAILLITAVNLVNAKQFLVCMKATSSDALVLWATIFSCFFFSLDMAFYIGVIISITLYLKKAAIPQLVEYDFDKSGELINLDLSGSHQEKNIRFIKVEGELFFGAADLFQSTLKSITEDDCKTKVIILQLKNARDIDATSCLALQQLSDYLRSSGRHLIACGITTPLWEVLCDSGIVESLGKENLFVFDERHPHQYMLKALARAYELVDTPQEAQEESEFDLIPELTSVPQP